jgi:hypothetical protein
VQIVWQEPGFKKICTMKEKIGNWTTIYALSNYQGTELSQDGNCKT